MVIFLDIDGVLNSKAFFQSARFSRARMEFDDQADDDGHLCTQIDTSAVKRLNKLLEQTQARVVLSSSWRCLFPLDLIQRVLETRGFVGSIEGITPITKTTAIVARGLEIQAWLENNEFDGPFVILDDDDDMEHLVDRLIHTDWENGLQDAHVEEAARRLLG